MNLFACLWEIDRRRVIRPDVSGLMGAYGIALLAAETAEELQKVRKYIAR